MTMFSLSTGSAECLYGFSEVPKIWIIVISQPCVG